jgi:hypothetical protein
MGGGTLPGDATLARGARPVMTKRGAPLSTRLLLGVAQGSLGRETRLPAFSPNNRTGAAQNPNSSAVAARSLKASRRTDASLVWNDLNSRGDST